MKKLKTYIFENNKDTTALKQKLIDLLANGDLDNEDLIKMYNIGKYSDKVLGYKAYDADHTSTQLKTVKGKQAYKYILKNKQSGDEVEVITSGDPYQAAGKGVGKTTYDIINKEEATVQKADPLYYDTPFKNRLSNIDINDDSQQSIIRLLRDVNMIDRYCSYIEKPSISVSDFINGSNLFKVLGKLRFTSKSIKKLATFQAKDKRGTALGNYEVLLKLVLSDYINTTRLDGKGGDIIAGGIAIEIKGDGGRLIGQNPGEAEKLNDSFYKFFRLKNQSAFNDFSKNCVELLKQLKPKKSVNGEPEQVDPKIDNPFVNPTKVYAVVKCLLDAGYSKEDIAKATALAMNAYYGDHDGDVIEDLILKYWDDISKKYSLIHRIIGCYQLIKYQEAEKWDYIAIFDERNKIINGEYIMISKDQLKMDYLYNLSNIQFDKGIAAKSSRDKALGINYRK